MPGLVQVPKWNIRQQSNAVPLVNRATFDRVQALLEGKRPTLAARLRNNPDFPLRNFVHCGQCGRPLTGSWSKGRKKRYAYYRCQNETCGAVQVRREEMERLFVEFLSQLKPKSNYLRLFSEIILDVWKQKQAQATSARQAAQQRLSKLVLRKQRLVEAFVYERVIDQRTYQEQLDRLNEEIALAEIEERDARIDEMDVDTALGFAEFVLSNAPRLWVELPLEQKQRLQQTLFPRGVQFKNGFYGTAETSMIFFDLGGKEVKRKDLVALTGIEPVFRP
jgi:site-specific DNA recombinase